MSKFYYQVITLLIIIFILLGGCSTTSQLSSTSKDISNQKYDDIEKYLPEETSFFSISDTSFLKKEVDSKLENARQHYLLALEAFQNNDSTTAVIEFEKAINVLDQLSYYPDIENNEEFTELSKSLIEDYEKLIISIDELDPDTPIFALREKINAEAGLIDISKENLKLPSELPKTQVPLVLNEPVKQFLYYFMTRGQKFVPNWFYRSGYYFPMMKRIFAEEGLPQELIYLSLIESGLNPAARSVASAVGLWQFVKSTGKLYGLNSNFWIDERRDPEKATRAAAKHLKDLYEIYQDWHLVLAAYNSGSGRVNSAIRRANSNDYWEISPKLPYETRGYVPQYIAISLIFMNPEEYGFTNLEYAKPFECDTIMINDCYDLEVLASAANVDENLLKLMNPELVQGCTPPETLYPLKVPKDKTDVFVSCIKQIPPEKRRTYLVHIVKKGETISSISKKYNISKSLLADVNGLEKYLKKNKRLPKGISLKIPLKNNNLLVDNINKKDNENDTSNEESESSNDTESNSKLKEQSDKVKIVYHIKEGDNLKSIAAMYDVRISDLRNWNNIPFGQEIDELDSLDIYVPKSKYNFYAKINELNTNEKSKLISTKNVLKPEVEKRWFTHKVRKNETLSSIADKYNISIVAIKKWNNLRNNTIKAGKVLKLYANQPVTTYYAESKNSSIKNSNEYQVQKNDTYYSIAKKYNLTVKELLSINNLSEESKLKVGQKLIVSKNELDNKKNIAKKETESTSLKEEKKPILSTYKVKKGDNLYSLASAYNISVDEIKRLNNLSDEIIKPGQTLKLQSNIPSSSKGDNDKPKTSPKKEYYKVKRGDTLYSISKKFNVDISELQKWNNLKSGLKAGDKIIVYR